MQLLSGEESVTELTPTSKENKYQQNGLKRSEICENVNTTHIAIQHLNYYYYYYYCNSSEGRKTFGGPTSKYFVNFTVVTFQVL